MHRSRCRQNVSAALVESSHQISVGRSGGFEIRPGFVRRAGQISVGRSGGFEIRPGFVRRAGQLDVRLAAERLRVFVGFGCTQGIDRSRKLDLPRTVPVLVAKGPECGRHARAGLPVVESSGVRPVTGESEDDAAVARTAQAGIPGGAA
ncbi:hypothetical protein [Streptomyces sp. SID161]|uniref:hypothetical protein n=1 Tax=Streptomyces sp. SID161 TaxID=2690251 RepID=UPI00136A6100|nr:hypothetical protein [Streptomyces sp. SID161]MYW44040.1 hypothetical protein [Streptomyces sp. SID161]